MKIYSYNRFSKGSRDLAQSLGVRRIKHRGSRFRPGPGKTVVNWGCGEENFPDELFFCNIINDPVSVSLCSNKLKFFERMSEAEGGPRLPDYLTSRDAVLESLTGDNSVEWVARTRLQGHSGAGIVLLKGNTPPEEIPEARLYTKYVKKESEWRVHILGGEVIDVQRKARSREVADEDVNWRVRNHANGFIFARNEGRDTPEDVINQALASVAASGLDFGAVDVLYNRHEGLAYVIEINTAPGLTGTTLENYTEAFRRFL